MRIAHLSAEVSPFAKTGGLADVVGALPRAQAALGHEVAVWMPLYRQVREQAAKGGWALEPAGEPFQLELGFESHPIALFRSALPGSSVPVFFVGNDRFFDRPEIYHADLLGHDDGLFRFAVFARAALEGMRRSGEVPEILHAHDWHAALVPMSLAWDKALAPAFAKSASVFTLHNPAFQGIYGAPEYLRLGLPATMRGAALWDGRLNLVKGAALTAHAFNGVSPTFARELASPQGGFGLDPIFRYLGDGLEGILNGVDRREWDPATDEHLARRYRADDPWGKADDKRALLVRAGMDPADPGLLVGLTGRLTHQKGFDLLLAVLEPLLVAGVRFVVLGAGEPPLERAVQEAARRSPGRFFAHVGFDEALAHAIVAGADAFLMPSRFEPCGLTQLYALAYGTLPVVRRTGGLVDTVAPFDGGNAGTATGFGFAEASPEALHAAVLAALRAFADQALWRRLRANAMAQDFGWERSARAYLDLYARTLAKRRARAAAVKSRTHP